MTCAKKPCKLRFLTPGNPEYSAAYATALSDENRRHNAIRDAARNWLRNDPAAATKWLNSTDLPDERKKELIDQASQNR